MKTNNEILQLDKRINPDIQSPELKVNKRVSFSSSSIEIDLDGLSQAKKEAIQKIIIEDVCTVLTVDHNNAREICNKIDPDREFSSLVKDSILNSIGNYKLDKLISEYVSGYINQDKDNVIAMLEGLYEILNKEDIKDFTKNNYKLLGLELEEANPDSIFDIALEKCKIYAQAIQYDELINYVNKIYGDINENSLEL